MMVSKFGISFSRDFFAVSMLNFRGVFLECKNFHWKTSKKGFHLRKTNRWFFCQWNPPPRIKKWLGLSFPAGCLLNDWCFLQQILHTKSELESCQWPIMANSSIINLPMLQITHLQGAFLKKEYDTTKKLHEKALFFGDWMGSPPLKMGPIQW